MSESIHLSVLENREEITLFFKFPKQIPSIRSL